MTESVTVEAVELPRERAVKLIMFCGWHAASEWDNEKLGVKLGELTTVYEPGKDATPDDAQTAADLESVLAGISAGSGFVVTGETTGEDGFFEEAAKVKEKKPRKPRQKKEKVEKPPKVSSGIEGVRLTASRAYHAAQIIKEAGLAAGITDAMAAEVDKRYGKPNEKYSKYALTNAWHALNGFLDQYPVVAE